jgi:hypothetical protein
VCQLHLKSQLKEKIRNVCLATGWYGEHISLRPMSVCSTVVEHSAHSPKINGSNPTTGAGRYKLAEKVDLK